jgi:4-hydroxy-tetrahydrodipicolinate synthase
MVTYAKHEARDWACATLQGAANVIIPSFTPDLSGLNEAGIRHDIRHDISLGFTGTLLVSETSTSPKEYVQFVEWASDESARSLLLIHHASFNSLDENIAMARQASAAGAELVLLAYPPNFYPRTSQDIFDFTKAFCDAIDLGVILFPVPLWGFERLHAASIAPEIVLSLVREVPNLVAIKAEGGMPAIGGFTHLYRLLEAEKVIVSIPIEEMAIPLATLVDIPWIGTSNYEYLGTSVPEMLSHIRQGNLTDAMEIYWRIDPARRAAQQIAAVPGANFAHRYLWKYMAWLQGFNGGPLRAPTMRIVPKQMRGLRQGLQDSGLVPCADSDEAFFVGRHD